MSNVSKNSAATRLSSRSVLYFAYCLILTAFSGCAMNSATPEDLTSSDPYSPEISSVHSSSHSVVSSTVPSTSGNQEGTTTPTLIYNGSGLTGTTNAPTIDLGNRCVCSWQTWSDSGMACAGIRCSDSCGLQVRGCVERHACVPVVPEGAGI